MKANMGKADKYIRFMLAALMLTLYFRDIVTGTLGIVLIVLSVIFVITGFINFCPLYYPFGVSTCKVKENKNG